MARLSFGFMVLLLTCSKITSANVLPAPAELTEKLNLNGENNSTDTGTPPSIEKANVLQLMEQNEDSNKFAKQSIDSARNKRQSNNNNNNPSLPQSASAPHPYSFFSLWQPQPHQIDRPYYIPVLRGPGGSTIILPPQPIPNFEQSFGNPSNEYIPPPNGGYLPPVLSPPDNPGRPPCANTTVDTPNKFGDFEEFGDTRPVWDMIKGNAMPTRSPSLRPTTPPSLIHNINDVDSKNELPNVTPIESTTITAASRPTPPSGRLPPSSCVWSIVSCCSSTSAKINYQCFEQQGCEGAFWDGSPCDAPLARAALASIMKYYETQY